MCTVSWLAGAAGYEVFFNRDERYRRPAEGPAITAGGSGGGGGGGGVSRIAPRDVEAGGTWLSVNSLGVTVGMTNYYPAVPAPTPSERVSRGLLLASLADAASLADVATGIGDAELPRYQPFSVVAFAPYAPARVLTWDGAALRLEDHNQPGFLLASSGAEPPGLQEMRRAVFGQAIERGGLTRETLTAVHASHLPERGALSVCVHRGIAGTVSFSHVIVGRDAVEFHYAPGPPGETPVAESVAVGRRR